MQIDERQFEKFVSEIKYKASLYYVSLTSDMNFELALKFHTWGVPDRHKNRIKAAKKGDYVLFFGGESGMYILKLASDSYYDPSRIWGRDVYPHRIKLEETPVLHLTSSEFTPSDMFRVLTDPNGEPYQTHSKMGLSIKGVNGSFRKLKIDEIENLTHSLELKKTKNFNVPQYEFFQNAIESIKKVINVTDPVTKMKRVQDRKYVLLTYGEMFNPNNLYKLTFEDIKRFSDINENRHWSGLERQASNIEKNNTIEAVRTYLRVLLDEKKPVQDRLFEANKNIHYAGPLILTAILYVAYPEKYCVLNAPSISALQSLGLIGFKVTNTALSKYSIVNGVMDKLVERSGFDRWDIDWALYQIDKERNTITNEGKKQPIKEMTTKNETEPTEYSDFPKNIILHGPVGTGKTVLADIIARKLVAKQIKDRLEIPSFITADLDALSNSVQSVDPERIKKITFHQSYGYEEFIEGISAKTNGSQIEYNTKPGVLREICQIASENPNKNYVLVIDEINRGEISRIFGELITTIEEDKRSNKVDGKYSTTLPLSGLKFFVPENLYIIGTMNNTDRSIALLDVALRRRFTFFYVPPSEVPISKWLDSENSVDLEFKEVLTKSFKRLNEKIADTKNEDFQIGQGFFSELRDSNDKIASTQWIFRYKIIPLLMEHYYGEYDRLKELLGECFIEDTNDSDRIIWKDYIFEENHKEEFKSELKKFSELDE
jgi:DNA polymerase III delta prime subunit